MNISQVKQVYDDLKKYCIFAKDNDYIVITEWQNGEGYDIDISTNKNKHVSLTHGELDAINHLIGVLQFETTKIE
jgi:hypothetical protein